MELRTDTEGGAEPDANTEPARRRHTRGRRRQIGSGHRAKAQPAEVPLQWITARIPGTAPAQAKAVVEDITRTECRQSGNARASFVRRAPTSDGAAVQLPRIRSRYSVPYS
jgi:hypothetical protein